MLPHAAIDQLEQQRWLDPVGDRLQQLVDGLLSGAGAAGPAIKDGLHGVWLGHALHPAVTDVPLGAWTTAVILDQLEAAGQRQLGPGADAAIAIGLIGAAGAAITGLADWSETRGEARRVGTLHAMLNSGATLLFAASLLRRRQQRRRSGRQLAALGYAIGMVSAYLGGHLVEVQRIGVNHAPEIDDFDEYTPVMPVDDLPDRQPRRVEARGITLVLVREGQQIYALANSCSHLGGPLNEGQLEECSIRCPWHGSRFALDDGRVLDGPASVPQPHFAVRVRNGQIEVRHSRVGAAVLDQLGSGLYSDAAATLPS